MMYSASFKAAGAALSSGSHYSRIRVALPSVNSSVVSSLGNKPFCTCSAWALLLGFCASETQDLAIGVFESDKLIDASTTTRDKSIESRRNCGAPEFRVPEILPRFFPQYLSCIGSTTLTIAVEEQD
jgi:hypothetical protein